MGYYRPRALGKIRVPVMGTTSTRLGHAGDRTTVEFNFPIVKCRITKNDFNVADECTIDVSYDQIGTDPRLLSNAILNVYMGDAPSSSPWQPTHDDLRFVGILQTPERKLSESERTMTLKAVDYTSMFLAMKPYPVDTGTPKYTMTLRQAWQLVCDNTGFYDFTTGDGKITSSVAELRDSIKGVPDDSILDEPIAKGVLSRVAAIGHVQVVEHDDAWSVWRHCCDVLGLLTWIDADVCYVSAASDYYSSKDPAVFVYGLNVKEASESRDVASLNGKGMHLTTFDPLSGHTLESFFPHRNDSRVVKKRLNATKSGTSPKARVGVPGLAPVTDYEHQVYPYPCNQASLDEACERVWEERSRQELEGRFQTGEMSVKSAAGKDVDVLAIKHGDQIVLKLEQVALDEMRRQPSLRAKVGYLVGRGFNVSTATLIAQDQGFLQGLLDTYFVRELSIDFDAQAEQFGVEVAYCSRISPNTGNADVETASPDLAASGGPLDPNSPNFNPALLI